MTALEPGRWYAIAAEHDLIADHAYRTALGGHELVAWRASDGTIALWRDRCPHRGVRLSLGEVVGDELRCQYHAWRFAKSGACTFIPAQPDSAVPAAIRATVWPVAQAGGLVWSGIDPVGHPPALPPGAVIRAVPIMGSEEQVASALAGLAAEALALTLQPVDHASVIVRGVATDGDVARADRVLMALRRDLEAAR
jgi:phenylpropionate dioxygenase-like ring-hydroxylating dioxygenase large terminal subunit